MRLGVTVGELETHDVVSLRKCEDGSINVIVFNRIYRATYQRTQNGMFLLQSNYPKSDYTRMVQALNSIETEIERRCIELSEAELRIDYKPVITYDGQSIKVGQSNSMTIYITIEDFEHRALFHYDGKKIKFIRSNYPPEDGEKIRTIIQRNFPKIVEVMEQYNMVEPKESSNKAGVKKSKLYKEGFSSCMTEVGKEERTKVDRLVEDIFKDLDSKDYSNLEIQSMLMESVFEVALQFRLKARSNSSY